MDFLLHAIVVVAAFAAFVFVGGMIIEWLINRGRKR